MLCITDFGDIFCVFINNRRVAIRELCDTNLEVDIPSTGNITLAVIAAEKELNLNARTWITECLNIKGEADIIRLKRCGIAATFKRCHGGARVVLSSWVIEGSEDI